jgi:hypothetical protein
MVGYIGDGGLELGLNGLLEQAGSFLATFQAFLNELVKKLNIRLISAN